MVMMDTLFFFNESFYLSKCVIIFELFSKLCRNNTFKVNMHEKS